MLTLAYDSTVSNPRRGWATLTSFAVQATAVAVALFIPLLRPQGSQGTAETGDRVQQI